MPVTSYLGTRDRAAATELYEFTYGELSNQVFRYTNAEFDLTVDGKVYSKLAISNDSVKVSGRPSEHDLNITVPRDSDIASHFRGVVPRRSVLVRIFRGDVPHSSDSAMLQANATFSPLYFGRVSETAPRDYETVLTCNTAGIGMRRPMLRQTYSRQCTRILYGDRCQASKAAATLSAVVSSVSDNVLVVEPGWIVTSDHAHFVGGTIEWEGTFGTDYRRIQDCNGDTFTMDGKLPGLAPTDSVSVVKSCQRTEDACLNVHNNIVNYGGTKSIPTVNPVNKNNHM